MTLPYSRDTNFVPDAEVPSATLNALQDAIVRQQRAFWRSINFFNPGYAGGPGFLQNNIDGGAMMNLAERPALYMIFPPDDERMAGILDDGGLAHSQDGIKWTQIALTDVTATPLPKAIHYCGFLGKWYVLGVQASVVEIAELVTITGSITSRNDPGTDFDRNAIADNGTNLLIIVRGDDGLLSSSDGSTWTERTNPATNKDMRGVVFGNGLWVAVGTLGTVITSVNGTAWTDRTTAAAIAGAADLVDVTYDPVNEVFVAVDSNGTGPFVSADGITWVQHEMGVPMGDGFKKIISDGAGALYCSGNTFVARSIDGGETWEAMLVEALAQVNGVTIAGGRFIIFGENYEAAVVGPNDPFGIGVGPRLDE